VKDRRFFDETVFPVHLVNEGSSLQPATQLREVCARTLRHRLYGKPGKRVHGQRGKMVTENETWGKWEIALVSNIKSFDDLEKETSLSDGGVNGLQEAIPKQRN